MLVDYILEVQAMCAEADYHATKTPVVHSTRDELNAAMQLLAIAAALGHKKHTAALNREQFLPELARVVAHLQHAEYESQEAALTGLRQVAPELAALISARADVIKLEANLRGDSSGQMPAETFNAILHALKVHTATLKLRKTALDVVKLIDENAQDAAVMQAAQKVAESAKVLAPKIAPAPCLLPDLFAVKTPSVFATNIEIINEAFAGGLLSQRLYLLAGRSNAGKTTLAASLLTLLAMNGQKCALISLEMSAQEMLFRFYASAADVPMHALKMAAKGQIALSEQQNNALNAAQDYASNYEIYDESSLGNASALLAHCEALAARGVRVIAIDNKDILDFENNAESASRALALGALVVALRKIAIEHDCMVLLLSQATRNALAPTELPNQQHLANSAAAYAAADGVFWIFRRDDGSRWVSVSKSRDAAIPQGAQAVEITPSQRVLSQIAQPLNAQVIA